MIFCVLFCYAFILLRISRMLLFFSGCGIIISTCTAYCCPAAVENSGMRCIVYPLVIEAVLFYPNAVFD